MAMSAGCCSCAHIGCEPSDVPPASVPVFNYFRFSEAYARRVERRGFGWNRGELGILNFNYTRVGRLIPNRNRSLGIL